MFEGRAFQAERTARAKALRWEQVLVSPGEARSKVWAILSGASVLPRGHFEKVRGCSCFLMVPMIGKCNLEVYQEIVTISGVSLVAQWMRSHWQCRRHGFVPWSRKIPHAMGQLSPMHHNSWASALEPRICNYWASMLQLLKPICPRVSALQREETPKWKACAPQLES